MNQDLEVSNSDAEVRSRTKQEVLDYLKEALSREWEKTADERIEDLMNCHFSMFGHLSANEFGSHHGWDYVMASFRRMYGG